MLDRIEIKLVWDGTRVEVRIYSKGRVYGIHKSMYKPLSSSTDGIFEIIWERLGRLLKQTMVEQEKQEGTTLEVQGVPIPLPGPAEDFRTAWWHDVVTFYPSFRSAIYQRKVLQFDLEDPCPFPAYLSTVLDQLGRLNVRGRAPTDWLDRIPKHFGPGWLKQQGEKYGVPPGFALPTYLYRGFLLYSRKNPPAQDIHKHLFPVEPLPDEEEK